MNISISFSLQFFAVIEQGLAHKVSCFCWLKDGKLCLITRDMQALLTAKLHTYGFHKEALKLISYLKHRKQKVKVNTTFSFWVDLICRVPQDSVLGPTLFNIFFFIYFSFWIISKYVTLKMIQHLLFVAKI